MDRPAGEADDLLRIARDVAREAAALMTRMRREGVEVAATKSSDVDVVTAADRACEELVRRRLAAARPDDGFHGEEGADRPGTSGVRWVVDPIDGTVNYLYGQPDHCVSVAAEVERDGRREVVAGVVLSPQGAGRGVEYAATRGGGATRDGEPIRVRSVVPLAQRLVATGFNYSAEVRARQGAAVARLLPRVRDVRRRGSCALDLCAVADGQVDAYVEEGTHAWDHAAGGLIATEAGARFALLPAPDQAGGGDADVVVCAAEGAFEDLVKVFADCGLVGR